MRWFAYLVAFVILGIPVGVGAVTLDDVMVAAERGAWSEAERSARQLDAGQGDFYAGYVKARQLASEGRCAEAVFLFDSLATARPYFALAYEGAFLCLNAMGETEQAVARLDSMLAILPDGAHRDLIFNIRQQVASADRPVINFFGSLVPSTNVNRQTGETHLGGWVVDPAAQSKAGLMASLGASVTARLYRSDRVTVSGVASAAANFNSANGMLEPRFTLETPVTFAVTHQVTAGVTPYLTTTFDADGLIVAKGGMSGVVSVPLTETIRATLSGGVGYATFPRQTWREGWQYELALAAQWSVTPQWLVTATTKAAIVDTADTTRKTAEISVILRLDHATDWGLLIGLEGEAGVRFHSQPAPLTTGPNQVDHFAAAKVELSHKDIVFGPFMPQVHYRYAIQDSDNVFYRHQAHDVGVGLRARF